LWERDTRTRNEGESADKRKPSITGVIAGNKAAQKKRKKEREGKTDFHK